MTYETSPIKRKRATKAEMQERQEALYEIAEALAPATVRQVFYQATVSGVVEKTERGYAKVQRALADMRRNWVMPFDWIADNTRWMRKPDTHDSPADAVRDVARFYRKNLWADSDAYVEIWLEKDALSGVVYPVTSEFDVPLMVTRGYASLTFLQEAGQSIAMECRPAYIYHLGDFDPSGQDAADKVHRDLLEYSDGAEIHFQKLAVTPEQIADWGLPTRPTKRTDTRSARFGYAESVELDAIDPRTLRDLVRAAIEQHMPPDEFEVLKVAERSEREFLKQWAGALDGKDFEATP